MGPAGVRNQDLISGINKRHHGQKDGLIGPHGDHDLPVGIKNEVIISSEFICDSASEFLNPIIGRIMNIAVVQSSFGCFLDILGSIKVGAADSQVHNVLPLSCSSMYFFENFANPRKGNTAHSIRVIHLSHL